jgi:hypothetical protein
LCGKWADSESNRYAYDTAAETSRIANTVVCLDGVAASNKEAHVVIVSIKSKAIRLGIHREGRTVDVM